MISVSIHDNPVLIPYEELGLPQSSPQTDYSLDVIRLTRYVKTAWDTTAELASELVGSVQQPSATGDSFVYFLPHRYIAMTTPYMRAISANDVPLGKSAAYSPGGELASYTQYNDAVM